eukprot:7492536-Karenia_brevis.AAC.1
MGMLSEWWELCRNREAKSDIFAYDPESGEKYMENKRIRLLPTFQTLMLMGLPMDAAYNSSDCLELAARDYHPCTRRMGHGRKLNHESIIDDSKRAPGERFTPADCLQEASGHDFMESRKRVEDIYK